MTERRQRRPVTKDNEFFLIKTKGLEQANVLKLEKRGQVPELAEPYESGLEKGRRVLYNRNTDKPG